MPNQINSSSSLWKQNQNDIFNDGKNDQSAALAGAIVTASAAEGQAQTTAAIDGDLSDIDTGAKALALDPAGNTGGDAVQSHSSTFLLRWAVKLLQGISGKIPALVGGKIPVEAGSPTAGDIGSAVDSALKSTPQPISTASLPLPTGAATESTLSALNDKIAPFGQAAMAASSPVAIASNQTSIPITLPNDAISSFTQTGVIAVNTDLLIIDCQDVEAVSIHCLSMGTAGIVTPSWSNTNAPGDFINQSIMTPAGVAAATFNAAGLWGSIKLARFLRLRLTTATTAGTTTINVLRIAQGLNYPLQSQPVSGAVTVSGSVAVSSLPSTPSGTNLIGDVSGQPRAGAGGLALPNRLVSSAASTNGTVVKASAGRVYKIVGYNNSATLRFLKLHNSATVTPGTTAVVSTYALKPNDYFDIDFGLIGQSHTTGICYSITGLAADNDTTPIALGDIAGLNVWFA